MTKTIVSIMLASVLLSTFAFAADCSPLGYNKVGDLLPYHAREGYGYVDDLGTLYIGQDSYPIGILCKVATDCRGVSRKLVDNFARDLVRTTDFPDNMPEGATEFSRYYTRESGGEVVLIINFSLYARPTWRKIAAAVSLTWKAPAVCR